jgi:serine/threonine protein kinase
VVRKLGEGATSEVWLCNDPFNLRDVAVKVAFTGSFSDPLRGKVYRKLFLTEAKLAGKLQHPHICQIHDAVADENLHYLVMEYVDGGTLEKYCQPDSLLAGRARGRDRVQVHARARVRATSRASRTATSSRPTSCTPARPT